MLIKTRLHKTYIEYDVPLVSQDDSMSCWAAAATMLYSWKKGRTYSIREAMGEFSSNYYYLRWLNENGLPFDENDDFYANTMGLTEVKYTPTPKGLQELLAEYGPLLVISDVNTKISDTRIAYHVRVIYGISGNGEQNCTYLKVLDPWGYGGVEQISNETYKEFKKKIYKTNNNTFFGEYIYNYHIYHW